LLSLIDAHAEALLEQQVKEKKWHENAWKWQWEAIRAIQKTKAELSNEIDCILGTAPDDEAAPEDLNNDQACHS
ncbi:MAG: hypothetical protein ACREDH_09360, partial [Methylocella sp.]